MIGNDIVDLSDQTIHPRFLERVFTKEEQALISAHVDPSIAIWIFWAIKEAAFKALSKIDPQIRFSYKSFVVREPWCCCYQEHVLNAAVSVTQDYVHAIAHGPYLEVFAAVTGSEDEREESKGVRQLARNLLETIGYPNTEIVKRPPEVHCDGKRIEELEVSLSHDKRYLAVVIGLFCRKA